MATDELGEAGLGPVVAFSTMIAANLWALAAVVVVARRARSAPAHEARRVRLFSVAFVVYLGSTVAHDVSDAAPAGFWLANYAWTPPDLLLAMPRFPGLLLLWYAVLAARVPHLREVVRAFYRRLLVRRGLLGAAAAAPAVGLGWLMASRPERSVGAAVTDPLVQSLFAAAGILLLVVFRGRLLMRLDAWVYPETADQRQSLAAATSALAQASQVRTIGRRVARTVNHGCGSRATLLVAADTETGTGDYGSPDGGMAPLARGSAIVHMLARGGGSVPAGGRFRATAGRARVRGVAAESQPLVAPGDGARAGRRAPRDARVAVVAASMSAPCARSEVGARPAPGERPERKLQEQLRCPPRVLVAAYRRVYRDAGRQPGTIASGGPNALRGGDAEADRDDPGSVARRSVGAGGSRGHGRCLPRGRGIQMPHGQQRRGYGQDPGWRARLRAHRGPLRV